MKGMADIFTHKIEHKSVSITQFEFSNAKDPLYNLRVLRDGNGMMYMYDGKYVRLHINGQFWMSDTNMEKITNSEFVSKANGKVLIAGLGIGLIIRNIQEKHSGVGHDVTDITVVEQSQDLIDVIQPYFPKVKMICADIHEYIPEQNEKFDTIYFDIWESLNTDNLKEMNGLARKFRKYLNKDNPDCYISSWAIHFLRSEKRKENREGWY